MVDTAANARKQSHPGKEILHSRRSVTFFICSLTHLLLHDLTTKDRGFLTLRCRLNPGRQVRRFLPRLCPLIQPWVPGSDSLSSADISVTHTAQMNSVKHVEFQSFCYGTSQWCWVPAWGLSQCHQTMRPTHTRTPKFPCQCILACVSHSTSATHTTAAHRAQEQHFTKEWNERISNGIILWIDCANFILIDSNPRMNHNLDGFSKKKKAYPWS